MCARKMEGIGRRRSWKLLYSRPESATLATNLLASLTYTRYWLLVYTRHWDHTAFLVTETTFAYLRSVKSHRRRYIKRSLWEWTTFVTGFVVGQCVPLNYLKDDQFGKWNFGKMKTKKKKMEPFKNCTISKGRKNLINNGNERWYSGKQFSCL